MVFKGPRVFQIFSTICIVDLSRESWLKTHIRVLQISFHPCYFYTISIYQALLLWGKQSTRLGVTRNDPKLQLLLPRDLCFVLISILIFPLSQNVVNERLRGWTIFFLWDLRLNRLGACNLPLHQPRDLLLDVRFCHFVSSRKSSFRLRGKRGLVPSILWNYFWSFCLVFWTNILLRGIDSISRSGFFPIGNSEIL